MASGIVSERKRSKCTVVGSLAEGRVSVVAEEGMMSHSSVVNARDIAKECATADGRVCHTFGVVDKCSRSSRRVEAVGRVVQKGCRRNGRVLGSLTHTLVADVEKEGSRTDSGVVAAVSIAPKRKPAYCCVPYACGQVNRAFCPSAVLKPG
jgi:hypothetical protein